MKKKKKSQQKENQAYNKDKIKQSHNPKYI